MPSKVVSLRQVTLEDKYKVLCGTLYLTGIQALVKLPLVQRELDRQAGLNTAGFISGYRGSPLGTYDQQLLKAKKNLDDASIRFIPGVNEELAATAIWGTQQLAFEPGSQVDGVFGIWYGKSPGVDRSMDALRHGNAAGSSPHGGVLVLAGDDHPGRSASVPNQSELDLISAAIPVLNPSSIEDYIRLGLHGIAMSRFSGCWSGMIVLAETVDGAASIEFDINAMRPTIPDGMNLEGLNIRWPDPHTQAEIRLHERKLPAVLTYAYANQLNKIMFGHANAKFGILTTGKAYLDVMQAFADLNVSQEDAVASGIRLMKADLIWPLEPISAREFSSGLDEILVIEEKRPTLEPQIKELLYNDQVRPLIVGKTDGPTLWEVEKENLFPIKGELSPGHMARTIAKRLSNFDLPDAVRLKIDKSIERINLLEKERNRPRMISITNNVDAILTQGGRAPSYCSGCPHNTSTKVPQGSRAMAGIGCHFMAQWIYPESTAPFTQMGSEGTAWVGQASFTKTQHMFVNLGDGTFYHSGVLAIRQAIVAKVNVTYKILYNDAVAMTGGQPVEGGLSVPDMVKVLMAEGVKKVVVVSDESEKYIGTLKLPLGVSALDRSQLDLIQREIRDIPGCTAIIYDQTCAAEKRRRRKNKTLDDPAKRVVINSEVCEGCGDCNKASNCLSIVPIETQLGRKRTVDQSSCNKDYRCIDGFCPSFVTVVGGAQRKSKIQDVPLSDLPKEPVCKEFNSQPFDMLIAGIGGSGVVTVGAIVGMAAHLQGLSVTVLDMTGLAQKGGAVFSHIRIAPSGQLLYAARIQEANLILGCDIGAVVESNSLMTMRKLKTSVITTSAEAQTGSFATNPDLKPIAPSGILELQQRINQDNLRIVDAHKASLEFLGDTIHANIFLLGYAWQRGNIPISLTALMKSIELNGVAVHAAQQAFQWGRVFSENQNKVILSMDSSDSVNLNNAEEIIAHRMSLLREYQDSSLAEKYRNRVEDFRKLETTKLPSSDALTIAVAKYYYKVLAIKDEYEVARLLSSPSFHKNIDQNFEGNYKIHYHLAPPAFAVKNPVTGLLQKRTFGPRLGMVLKFMAYGRKLRNTFWDPFRNTPERLADLQWVKTYEQIINFVQDNLGSDNFEECIDLLSLPEHVRGYGHVRHAALKMANDHATRLISVVEKKKCTRQHS